MSRTIFKNRWWIVFASVMGLIGGGSMTVFVFSVFIRPVTEEFGWSRGQFGAALGVHSIVAALALPIFGRAFDKYGSRAVLLPTIVGFAAATALMALLQPSIAMLLATYMIIGFFAGGQSPVPYSKIISGWFDDRRGLALGVAIAGGGIGTSLMPVVAQALTSAYGWRVGYAGLGLISFMLAFPAVALLMREPPKAIAHADAAAVPGMAVREALKSGRFWLLAIAFFCGVTPVHGVITQGIALLTDRGLPAEGAASVLGISGIVIVCSRLISGYAIDRVHAPLVGAAFLCMSLIGILVLAGGAVGWSAAVGAALCGLAVGCEVDLLGFLVSRYFGLHAFGAVFGYMFMVIPIGVGAGSLVMGIAYDFAHSYEPALLLFIPMMIAACVMLLQLGPYRFTRQPEAERAIHDLVGERSSTT